MTFPFQGVDTEFKDIFYLYALDTEGYRTDVYKDEYGNNTVGIGHLVVPEDNLSYKDVISKDQVKQFFDADYDRLGIEKYVEEVAQNYNQGLGLSHFIFRHGDNSYKDSELRQHLINHDLDYSGTIDYLTSHGWDSKKASSQKDNKADFTVFYSDVPWSDGKSVSYYVSQIKSFAVTNPLMTYGIAGTVVMGASLLIYGGIRLLKNKRK